MRRLDSLKKGNKFQTGEMILTTQPGSFLGARSAAPNQFLRQSPSPSAVSPVGVGSVGSNQMAVSPALVPSPSSSQLTPVLSGPPRSNGKILQLAFHCFINLRLTEVSYLPLQIVQ